MKIPILKLFCYFMVSCGFLFPISIKAQNDTVRSHYISGNLLALAIAGEVGFYYEYWTHPLISYRASYGHRFWQPNIIENGGAGSGIQYYPGQADAVRLGIKIHSFNSKTRVMKAGYGLCQLNGFFFDSGKYTTRQGSNGLNSTRRWVTKIERYMGGVTLGGGFIKMLDGNMFADYFLAVGFAMGSKKTTNYSYGTSDGNQFDYDPDVVEKSKALMPLLEFGICVGGFW